MDSGAFQRLRYIRQLGLAHLVYPGATHTRFDHAIGVYHLVQRTLAVLRDKGDLARVPATECAVIPFAALLHDIGHYPFSHALEELEQSRIPGHHETLVSHFLADGEVRSALQDIDDAAPAHVESLIRGASSFALQGLVSGSLDLDKIEYLKRDARFCGVPYGEVDVDRLLHGLTVVEDPSSKRLELGVHEKGIAALESLLFAKYQMFRNVYWHHAVRAATVMYKRIVNDALELNLLQSSELVGQTDEGLLYLLEARTQDAPAGAEHVRENLIALRERRLPKRAGEVVATELHAEPGDWLALDTPLKRAVEDQIARELGLPPGAAYLDFPEKSAMFHLNLLVERKTGEVIRLGPAGEEGLIGLPRIADELYRTARVLRLFTQGKRRVVRSNDLASIAARDEKEIASELRAGRALVS